MATIVATLVPHEVHLGFFGTSAVVFWVGLPHVSLSSPNKQTNDGGEEGILELSGHGTPAPAPAPHTQMHTRTHAHTPTIHHPTPHLRTVTEMRKRREKD